MSGPYVDVSKFPPDEKAHIIDMGNKLNAVKGRVDGLEIDVDQISGNTPEIKKDMWRLFGDLQLPAHYLGAGSHKVNVVLGSVALAAIVYVLKQLGVDTQTALPAIGKFIATMMGGS